MNKHGVFISRIQAVDTNVLGWKGLHDWTIMRKKENRILNDLFRKAEKTILTGRISGFFR